MTKFDALIAQAKRKNFWLLAAIGMLSILVATGLYAIYADINELDQKDLVYKKTLLDQLEDMQNVASLQLEFKSQVQEWKDILLRGHDSVQYQRHWHAFERSEAAVRKTLEASYQKSLSTDFTPRKSLPSESYGAAEWDALIKQHELETAHSDANHHSVKVLRLMSAHRLIGLSYRQALQQNPVTLLAQNAFLVDEHVRGLDRWFSGQLQLFYQENVATRQRLLTEGSANQQAEIVQVKARIQRAIFLVVASILLNIMLLIKRISWSSNQLAQSDAQLKTSNTQLEKSFEQLKISSQQLKAQAQQSQSTIFQLAYSDTLTGLPNRRLFQDKLASAIALTKNTEMSGALLFMDLDNFKSLNDTKGHAAGDLLLKEVATRLRSAVRDVDTVARLGGDEFVVILDDLSKSEVLAAEQAGKVAAKISFLLHQPYLLNDWVHRGSVSIGVALFKSGKTSSEELIKNADMAMYQAKKAGRNTVCFFDEQIQSEMMEYSALEAALWTAQSDQQLHVYYQLQVGPQRQAIGAEALLRWLHPVRGMIYPSQFIQIAEQNGLILPIGYWVIKSVCTQLGRWQNDPLMSAISVSVNVSPRQLQDYEFVDKVKSMLLESAINPAYLKLEITESMALHNVEHTILTLQQLKSLGVSLSMDDFGIGHSSLSQLKRLPLDQIKIDQSFVNDLVTDSNDKTIVQTIIAMAKSMDLEVIAEGVETEAQCVILQEMGCVLFQGYLFSQPIPLVEFERLLAVRTI
ncbi:MAG: EAL domain-containing protein [Gallionella sp.]|nr:EAL domain-containing protein [Gallionella sp.]MDD4958608.1 EAL domain-containing protein [Gallionella sp.]